MATPLAQNDELMKRAAVPASFSGLSGGRTSSPVSNPQERQAMKQGRSDVRDGRVQPSGPKAGNAGFERFLALHRGSRGGSKMSGRDKKSGFIYTEGPFKGMTEGQADIRANQKFQKMNEAQRDDYRPMNEGDYAKSRERKTQAERDDYAMARENAFQTRADIEASKPKVPDTTTKKPFDPNAPKEDPNASAPPVANPSTGAADIPSSIDYGPVSSSGKQNPIKRKKPAWRG